MYETYLWLFSPSKSKPFPKVAAIMGSNFCNTQKSKTLKSQYSSHDLYYKKMYKQWKKQYWNFSSEGDGPLVVLSPKLQDW
jgi:hypothetical protein